MDKEKTMEIAYDYHLSCFGNFNIADSICKRFCALSLQCIIERDQNTRQEIIEDFVLSENSTAKEH